MSETASIISFSLYGIELALVPPALTVYLHVPFGLSVRTPPTVDEYERLDALNAGLSDAVMTKFAEIAATAGEVPRSEIIARRKEAELCLALPRSDLILICRALRDVSLEYGNEPKGINVFFGGDEYGTTVDDLIAVRDRLCNIAHCSDLTPKVDPPIVG